MFDLTCKIRYISGQLNLLGLVKILFLEIHVSLSSLDSFGYLIWVEEVTDYWKAFGIIVVVVPSQAVINKWLEAAHYQILVILTLMTC